MDDRKFQAFLQEKIQSKFAAQKFSLGVRPKLCEQLLFCHDWLLKRVKETKRERTTKKTIQLTPNEKRLFDEEELLSAFQSIIANASGLHRHSSSVPFSLSARPPPPPPRLAVHRFCRQGLYPNTSIARQYFDDNHVPWSMNFPDYHPPFYTKSQSTPETDPETIQSDMMWNEFDTHYNVDRRTANPSGRYLIDAHGYPLNPLGRTGLVGRGQLPRWAVNYQTHLVIMLGTNELDQGREIFEYLIERPLDDDSCRLLSTWTTGTHMEAIKKTLRTYLMSIYHLWNGNEDLNENEVDAITEHLTFVSTAYIDDARNTDNAWLETSVCCYIQTDLHPAVSSNPQIDLKRLFPHRTSNSQMKYCWSRLNQHSTLLESEREVVQLISQRYHAAW